MTKEQIDYLLATYGLDNLMFISMNNNRRIHIGDKLRASLVFDHTNNMLTFPMDDYTLHEMRDFAPRNVMVAQDYGMLEAFIFATDEKSRLR
jgi:hypothetical protein